MDVFEMLCQEESTGRFLGRIYDEVCSCDVPHRLVDSTDRLDRPVDEQVFPIPDESAQKVSNVSLLTEFRYDLRPVVAASFNRLPDLSPKFANFRLPHTCAHRRRVFSETDNSFPDPADPT